ncbi:hypothetical protein M758_4G264200 [Ceratodon purpureus]|nr:hypothetical protein M758_4G264200 [Ceratodon purpureus]
MRMTKGDGSLELFGEYRRGSNRKPPRPHARRRRCAPEDVRRSSGRLTTFQKLDREMEMFVKAQKAGRLQGGGKDCGLMQVSEEDSSVRGVRHGVKWKCGWMFEQDSLYWETVRRQDVSGGEEKDPWCRAQGGKSDAVKEKGLKVEQENVSTCDSSSALECDGALRHHCSTDHESVSSGMELHLRRRTHASRRSRRDAELNGQKSFTDHEENAGEEGDKNSHLRTEKGWPAVLKAKCVVLQMEKELADQKLQQQCAEMAQAAEMAHCLRASVQTILETAKRGTVSAPCTPGRLHFPEESPCIKQRIQRLQTVNVQRDLEEQAKSFQNRIDNLRLKSQVRSGDSFFRSKEVISKTPLSSTSTTTQVLTSDGEDWAQVQEVLKQLRGKTGSLQFNCENWEKRAIFAEAKAASLQIEEEKWRLEAQKSEEKVRELERELLQVRATLEEVRNRHALEQSRLLGSGSNHGYTLVLQPIVTNHGSSTGCRCTTSADCESCLTCGGHHRGSASGNHQARVAGDNPGPEVSKEATFENGDEIFAIDEPASDPAANPNELMIPSPDKELSETTSGQGSSRHRNEGVESEGEVSPTPTPNAGAEYSIVHENVKTEVEKSLSQKWFKQRPKSRRPGTQAGCEITVSETRNPNLGNSPIPEKRFGGAGRGSLAGHNGVIRKPGPVSAGSMRVSSPSHLQKRLPLREIKRNSAPNDCTKTECS